MVADRFGEHDDVADRGIVEEPAEHHGLVGHDAAYPRGMEREKLQRYRRTEGMTDQMRAALKQRRYMRRLVGQAIGVRAIPGRSRAVADEIDRVHAKPALQHRGQRLPLPCRARAAMQQHDRGAPVAPWRPVVRVDHRIFRRVRHEALL